MNIILSYYQISLLSYRRYHNPRCTAVSQPPSVRSASSTINLYLPPQKKTRQNKKNDSGAKVSK